MKKLDFNTAFKYPFNRPVGLLYILWVFLPIIGWFALGGYGIRIVKEFSKGEFKKLPIFDFGSDLSLGFYMFIKAIPFMFVYFIFGAIVGKLPFNLGGLANLLAVVFAVPILMINFFVKETADSFFEFAILKSVLNNLGDYLLAFVMSILLAIVFAILSIVLVGIPAGTFTKNIFLVDFYRRKVK